MWFWVQLSERFDYDAVKNYWLKDFETKDKDIKEGEFYIKLNTIEDVLEVSNLIGKNIVIGTFCDEPTIII